MAQFTGTGSLILGGTEQKVYDCEFVGAGVLVAGGYDVLISGCLFQNQAGIVFLDGTQTQISHNMFSGQNTSILLDDNASVDTLVITDNRFEVNVALDGNDVYLGGLLFADNQGYGGDVIGLVGDYITVQDNRFIGGGDIFVDGAVFYLQIIGNAVDGDIVARGFPDEDGGVGGLIANNHLQGGRIEVHDFHYMDVIDNLVLYSTDACIIVAGDTSDVTVRGNHLDDPGASSPSVIGVDIQDSTVVDTWVVLNRFGPGLGTAISDAGTGTSTTVSVGSAGDNYDAT